MANKVRAGKKTRVFIPEEKKKHSITKNKWCDKELAKLNSITDPLAERISQYMNLKGIGEVVIMCSNYVMRMYLHNKGGDGQEEIAKRDFKYLKALMDKKGHVDSLVYKAIELGELLKCKEFYGTCQHAKNCWVTRRGWCQQEKDMKMKNF